jgi:hypothetical protein
VWLDKEAVSSLPTAASAQANPLSGPLPRCEECGAPITDADRCAYCGAPVRAPTKVVVLSDDERVPGADWGPTYGTGSLIGATARAVGWLLRSRR